MLSKGQEIIQKINNKTEYAVVKNPNYVFPKEEYYPLAARNPCPKQLKAVLMDMDGTTTTTEELCIYSLEQMIRKMSGLTNKSDWMGLDKEKDYPHIIGDSTTRHVEYLISTYSNLLNHKKTVVSFIQAAYKTLIDGKDETRKSEVKQNLNKLGSSIIADQIEQGKDLISIKEQYHDKLPEIDFSMQVNIGIDIYYAVYHDILDRINKGESDEVKKEIFGDAETAQEIIAPMPGIELLIPLLKGWLGQDAAGFADNLIEMHEKTAHKTLSQNEKSNCLQQLTSMGKYFEKNPVKLGLVTSSIRHEANIVVSEIYRFLSKKIEESTLPEHKKKLILEAYKDYHTVYEAFVTASDSSEIRLKPHRDLYSIALHQVGMKPDEFDTVIGLEDSKSGTIAIRAAGIGCCVALPFTGTNNHSFEAATHIVKGGIPELLIEHQLFIEAFKV